MPRRFISSWSLLCRIAGLVLTLLFAVDATGTLAQSATCDQLNTMLQSLSRNTDYSNSGRANENLRALQADERNAEQAYTRTGCQADQQARRPQTPQCRGIARQILTQRDQISQLSQSANSGNAIAQQRQQVMQQISRYGCSQQNSGSRFTGFGAGQPQQQAPRRRSFLDDLFGGGQPDNYNDPYGDQGAYDTGDQVQDPYANQQQQNTIRTVCARLSDGYYWPISYSTVRDYIPQDAATCQAQCPNQQVDLYYYYNPGQEPEQMVDSLGQTYISLPNAFAYRKQFDLANSCKQVEPVGKVSLDDLGNGQSRAMISYDGDSFPLPLRDPRQVAAPGPTVASSVAFVDIPLPRPRPDSKAAAAAVLPTTEPVISARDRTVKVGDKIVRLVGPDTPYAPSTTAAGDAG